MPDIQIFWSCWNATGRLHFATLPDDVGDYPPYKGLYFKYKMDKHPAEEYDIYRFPGYIHQKKPFTAYQDYSIGYKFLHFDSWTSIGNEGMFRSLLSVNLYYHERVKYPGCKTVFTNMEHKGIRIPSLLKILHHKRFLKQMAISCNQKKIDPNGLGALFG